MSSHPLMGVRADTSVIGTLPLQKLKLWYALECRKRELILRDRDLVAHLIAYQIVEEYERDHRPRFI